MLHRPVPVAPLKIETEEERRLFKKGEANYKAKKSLRQRSLLEQAPNDEESNLIHSMWMKEASWSSKQSSSRGKTSADHTDSQ